MVIKPAIVTNKSIEHNKIHNKNNSLKKNNKKKNFNND